MQQDMPLAEREHRGCCVMTMEALRGSVQRLCRHTEWVSERDMHGHAWEHSLRSY